jgi:hypothetical protein
VIQTIFKCDVCGTTVNKESLYYAKFTNLDVCEDTTSCDICNVCLKRLMERARNKMGIDEE